MKRLKVLRCVRDTFFLSLYGRLVGRRYSNGLSKTYKADGHEELRFVSLWD